MDCEHRVLDVFVTNADPNLEDDYDDQFICAVQSVRLHVESSDNYAVIVEDETDWVTVTFPHDHASDPFKTISKGDLIRVGGPSTGGFTDYLTVVEKVPIKAYRNATVSNIAMRSNTYPYAGHSLGPQDAVILRHHETWLRPYGTDAGNDPEVIGYNTVLLNDGTTTTTDIISYDMDVEDYVPRVQQYALRLNHSINATTINEPVDLDRSKRIVAGTNVASNSPDSLTNIATLEQRHLVTTWNTVDRFHEPCVYSPVHAPSPLTQLAPAKLLPRRALYRFLV